VFHRLPDELSSERAPTTSPPSVNLQLAWLIFETVSVIGMDMPADLTLTRPSPLPREGSVMLICVIPDTNPAAGGITQKRHGLLRRSLDLDIAVAPSPSRVSPYLSRVSQLRDAAGQSAAARARTLDERGAIEAPPCVVTVRIGNGPYVNGRSLIR